MPTPQTLAAVVDAYLPQPHAALLNGMLLGLPIVGYKELYENLKIVGLLHLVVLSGMNITLMTTMVTQVTGVFGRKTSLVMSVLIIVFFITFVSPQAPVVRAGFCSIFTIVALLFGRKAHPVYLLLLSAICIGIFWPSWLTSISFQLSYGATLGILLFNKRILMEERTLKDKFIQGIKSEFRTSIAAQVFTAPLIFLHFKQLSLISPVANVLVCFMVGPIMIVGFMAILLGKISPVLGAVPAAIVFSMLGYVLYIIELLSKIPFVFIQL